MGPLTCLLYSSVADDKIDSNHVSEDLSQCSKDSLIALPSNQGLLNGLHNIDVPVTNDYSDLMHKKKLLNTRDQFKKLLRLQLES